MKKRHRRRQRSDQRRTPSVAVPTRRSDNIEIESQWNEGRASAVAGRYDEAIDLLERVARNSLDSGSRATVFNDLGVAYAAGGRFDLASARLDEAHRLAPRNELVIANRLALDRRERDDSLIYQLSNLKSCSDSEPACPPRSSADDSAPVRVAIVSFLFNWPSTGGGIVHTLELAKFLAMAGFDVLHVYARQEDWGVGRVVGDLPYPSHCLEFFRESDWNLKSIQARFREAIQEYQPDHVIITDSWNMKPRLAEALAEFPFILRLQALECLCPLNNLRLLPGPAQCPRHQLATPAACQDCLQVRGHLSGSLHQAERQLAEVGSPEYPDLLRRMFAEAEAVLVVNPMTEAMVSPFCRQVRVCPSGFDPSRFPWPWPSETDRAPPDRRSIFFAGLVEEGIKGFQVLHEACQRLWQKRHDFELVATGDPPGQVDDFTRFVGWLSQEELPAHLRRSDILAFPTIAQEALGRTAVEAMAVGRPVVASRIGGLPYTIGEGAGLLFEPGDVDDLAAKLESLLDHPELCEQMGRAGRRRFESEFTWPHIIDRHYRPLLAKVAHRS